MDIPCTFDRPSRRRGPPNRCSEAIKRKRLDSPASQSSILDPLSTHSSPTALNAESICPFAILECLVDVFFKYIYPLYPFPHEPSFRLAFKGREDLRNSSFLALIASMMRVLALCYPHQPGLNFHLQGQQDLFLGSMNFAERCHRVAVEARGPGYLDKDLTIYDAVTSYFLGLASVYTFRWNQTRLYFGEALALAKLVGISKFEDSLIQDTTYYQCKNLRTSENQGTEYVTGHFPTNDFIKREVSRRVFWVLYVWIRYRAPLGMKFELTLADQCNNVVLNLTIFRYL